jgi:hypothetical protein
MWHSADERHIIEKTGIFYRAENPEGGPEQLDASADNAIG